MPTEKTLDDLFLDTLKDIYYAETALTKALPKVSKAAGDAKLKQAVDHHLKQTKGHVQTLKKVFASLDLPAKGKKCDGIDGLIKEADGIKPPERRSTPDCWRPPKPSSTTR